MNLNTLTEKAREALFAAKGLAEQANHSQIEPEHLLAALVEQRDGVVPEVLRKMNVDPRRVAADARAALGRRAQVHGGSEAELSPRLAAILDMAQAEAGRMKDDFVSTEHLLLALAAEGARDEAAKILQQHGVAAARVLKALTSVRGSSASPTRIRRTSIRPWSGTAGTSPTWRARASSTRSSAGTRRSAA